MRIELAPTTLDEQEPHVIALSWTCAACASLTLPDSSVASRTASAPPAPNPILRPATDEPSWTFDALVYFWSASVSGNLTVQGEEVDLEGGGDGIFEISALSGFLGDFEAHRGPWSFVLAPIFVSVDMSGDGSGGTDAAVSIDAQIHEAFVTHEIGVSWEWLLGARYYELDTDVDFSLGGAPVGSADSNRSWVDPIVGARYHGEISDRWSVRARADVGGFGVGSDLSWNASVLAGYAFSSTVRAQVGYRALHVKFQDGTGGDRLEYDLSMFGPIIGVSFSF